MLELSFVLESKHDVDCGGSKTHLLGPLGPYSCANGGFCTSPGQCLCKKDMWTGFDCRKVQKQCIVIQ